MNPRFTVTRKTYYALGLLAAACSTAGALFVLTGQAAVLLDNLAFVLTGMMFLLLAAIKGSPKQQKSRYFICFVQLIGSTVVTPGVVARLLAASCWPAFLWAETLRDPQAGTAARLLTVCEGLGCVFWLAVSVAGLNFAFAANVFWLLTAITRGWAALRLYKAATPPDETRPSNPGTP